jgi:hypothetical protein
MMSNLLKEIMDEEVYNTFYPVYDEKEEEVEDSTDDDSEDDTDSDETQIFNQEQVNKFLAKEKRKWQKEREKLVGQIEDLTKNTNLSDEDRTSWENKLKQIKDENENKVIEQSKKLKKLQKQLEDTVKEKDEQIGKFKNLFIGSSVRRDISDAAIETQAFNPKQIVGLLLPRSEYRPVLDEEGKETGTYETWIKNVETVDEKTGKTITIDMKAKDAVMTLNETDPNLFKPNLVGGLDTTASKGSGEGPPDMKNYDQYKKWREKNDLRRIK